MILLGLWKDHLRFDIYLRSCHLNIVYLETYAIESLRLEAITV